MRISSKKSYLKVCRSQWNSNTTIISGHFREINSISNKLLCTLISRKMQFSTLYYLKYFISPYRYPASSYCYIPHAQHSSKCGGGQSRPLADLSQGSCENTPATPDSLDSLVGSDEDSAVSSPLQKSSCSSDRLQCTSSVLSPLSDDLERPPRASSSNR